MNIAHNVEQPRAKAGVPKERGRLCQVAVLVPGKKMVEHVQMRWNGREWLFEDGLRLSHAIQVLHWMYL